MLLSQIKLQFSCKSNQTSILMLEIDASLTHENYHSKKTNMLSTKKELVECL